MQLGRIKQHSEPEPDHLSPYQYIAGQLWLKEYPVHYAGCDFNSRMTVIRLHDGTIMLHSPCEIDEQLAEEIEGLGPVAFIIAPGTYHYQHIASAQEAFPDAETFICPGIEHKCPDIKFDWILSDKADPRWEPDFDQVLVRGTRYIWEIAFFHKPSKTLILVDLLENFTDETAGVNWPLKFWWKAVFHMWNHPKAAPEYQLGWKDKTAAKKSLQRILEWDFERIIMAHGDLIDTKCKEIVTDAWSTPLECD